MGDMRDSRSMPPDHEGLQAITPSEDAELVVSPYPLSGNTPLGSNWLSPVYDAPITRPPTSPHPTHPSTSPYTNDKILYDPTVDGPKASQTSLPAGGCEKVSTQQEPRICGVGRRTFWLVLGIVNFTIIIALGLGVGLAIGLKEDSTTASATSGSRSTTSSGAPLPSEPSPWGFPLPTPTAAAVTNTSGTTDDGTRAACPDNDRTAYTAYKTRSKFLLLCGRDYPADVGDNVSLFTDDRKEGIHSTVGIGECIELCATRAECEGVGFFYNMCLFKRRARTPKKKEATYPFALRIVDG